MQQGPARTLTERIVAQVLKRAAKVDPIKYGRVSVDIHAGRIQRVRTEDSENVVDDEGGDQCVVPAG